MCYMKGSLKFHPISFWESWSKKPSFLLSILFWSSQFSKTKSFKKSATISTQVCSCPFYLTLSVFSGSWFTIAKGPLKMKKVDRLWCLQSNTSASTSITTSCASLSTIETVISSKKTCQTSLVFPRIASRTQTIKVSRRLKSYKRSLLNLTQPFTTKFQKKKLSKFSSKTSESSTTTPRSKNWSCSGQFYPTKTSFSWVR